MSRPALAPMSARWLKAYWIMERNEFEGVGFSDKFQHDEELLSRVEPRSLASSAGIYRNAITGQRRDRREDRI